MGALGTEVGMSHADSDTLARITPAQDVRMRTIVGALGREGVRASRGREFHNMRATATGP